MSTFILPVLLKDVGEQGLKGTVEVHKLELPRQLARVRDLIAVLNNKIGNDSICSSKVRFIQLYGARLSNERLLESLIPDRAGNCARIVAVTQTVYSCSGVQVFVRSLSGKTRPFTCRLDETIYGLKTKIEARDELPSECQRLICAGKQLEDDRTLASYAIQKDSTLDLVMFLRGGYSVSQSASCQTFADVSGGSLLTRIKFSDAPDWTACCQGLNIEGRCVNSTCDAFNKMVVHQKGFKPFNLLLDGYIKCPMCASEVKPITCGFYDCVWKFDGVRASDMNFISSQWHDARGEYYYGFDADEEHGCVAWESLLIVAKSREKATVAKLLVYGNSSFVCKNDTCTICWSKFGSTSSRSIATSFCGHSFHRACVEELTNWCSRNVTSPRCPICNKQV